MTKDVDDRILEYIKNEFKTVREISSELSLHYVRVAVRMKKLRRSGSVISIQSENKRARGVKPIKYRKK